MSGTVATSVAITAVADYSDQVTYTWVYYNSQGQEITGVVSNVKSQKLVIDNNAQLTNNLSGVRMKPIPLPASTRTYTATVQDDGLERTPTVYYASIIGITDGDSIVSVADDGHSIGYVAAPDCVITPLDEAFEIRFKDVLPSLSNQTYSLESNTVTHIDLTISHRIPKPTFIQYNIPVSELSSTESGADRTIVIGKNGYGADLENLVIYEVSIQYATTVLGLSEPFIKQEVIPSLIPESVRNVMTQRPMVADDTGIEVWWQAPENDALVGATETTISFYEVYRAMKNTAPNSPLFNSTTGVLTNGSVWQKVSNFGLGSAKLPESDENLGGYFTNGGTITNAELGTSVYRFVDTGLTNGKLYWYSIRAVREKLNQEPDSTVPVDDGLITGAVSNPVSGLVFKYASVAGPSLVGSTSIDNPSIALDMSVPVASGPLTEKTNMVYSSSGDLNGYEAQIVASLNMPPPSGEPVNDFYADRSSTILTSVTLGDLENSAFTSFFADSDVSNISFTNGGIKYAHPATTGKKINYYLLEAKDYGVPIPDEVSAYRCDGLTLGDLKSITLNGTLTDGYVWISIYTKPKENPDVPGQYGRLTSTGWKTNSSWFNSVFTFSTAEYNFLPTDTSKTIDLTKWWDVREVDPGKRYDINASDSDELLYVSIQTDSSVSRAYDFVLSNVTLELNNDLPTRRYRFNKNLVVIDDVFTVSDNTITQANLTGKMFPELRFGETYDLNSGVYRQKYNKVVYMPVGTSNDSNSRLLLVVNGSNYDSQNSSDGNLINAGENQNTINSGANKTLTPFTTLTPVVPAPSSTGLADDNTPLTVATVTDGNETLDGRLKLSFAALSDYDNGSRFYDNLLYRVNGSANQVGVLVDGTSTAPTSVYGIEAITKPADSTDVTTIVSGLTTGDAYSDLRVQPYFYNDEMNIWVGGPNSEPATSGFVPFYYPSNVTGLRLDGSANSTGNDLFLSWTDGVNNGVDLSDEVSVYYNVESFENDDSTKDYQLVTDSSQWSDSVTYGSTLTTSVQSGYYVIQSDANDKSVASFRGEWSENAYNAAPAPVTLSLVSSNNKIDASFAIGVIPNNAVMGAGQWQAQILPNTTTPVVNGWVNRGDTYSYTGLTNGIQYYVALRQRYAFPTSSNNYFYSPVVVSEEGKLNGGIPSSRPIINNVSIGNDKKSITITLQNNGRAIREVLLIGIPPNSQGSYDNDIEVKQYSGNSLSDSVASTDTNRESRSVMFTMSHDVDSVLVILENDDGSSLATTSAIPVL